MNDQSTKKICFNKSILLSLKAEVLKKQEEITERKQLPQHKVENFKPPKAEKQHKHNERQENYKTFRGCLKAVDTEELEACRKSKSALEKKAKLYEHLSDGTGDSMMSERFLVDFNGKKQDGSEKSLQSTYSKDKADNDSGSEDGEDWVEYVDCLGRTRKCLKTELELYKKRDKELLKAMTNGEKEDPVEETPTTEKPFLVKKTNDYLKTLRVKWDKEEKDVLAKKKDIHYQDLLFDEARMHGVGYYSFSTDEATRQKQMEELMKQREETLLAQREAEERKKRRDELMSARIVAARARQRARAGLPPEEPQKNEKDFTTCLLEFLTQQRKEADAKANEEEKRVREEQEKERQKVRDAYVREWDIGKEGMNEKVKKFKELTQDEYVEQQREKRIEEFAPLQESTEVDFNKIFDENGKLVTDTNNSVLKTWAEVRPKTPPPIIQPIVDESPKGLYFSTKNIKYKNFVPETTPIENAIRGGGDGSVENQRAEKRKSDANSKEIPPPPTYDYYGPLPKHSKVNKPFESDINEAYTQGTKSLEPKVSNRKLPKHYDFTFD